MSSVVLLLSTAAKADELPVAAQNDSSEFSQPIAPTQDSNLKRTRKNRPFVSKKIKTGSQDAASILFVVDLEKQKTSLNYMTASRIETNLALNPLSHHLSLSFEYRW